MYCWEEVQDCVRTGELQCLKRTPEITEKYHLYKSQLASEGTTVANAVVDRKLQWSRDELVTLQNRYSTVSERTQAMLSDPSLYSMLPNDFPYDLGPNLYHFVIWSKIPIPLYKSETSRVMNPPVRDKIERFIRTNLERFGIHDYEWFINYPYLQSVKTVSHIHLMIKATSPDVADKI